MAQPSLQTPPNPASTSETPGAAAPKFGFLPKVGSPGYYALLAAVAILILGPLGGITAAYMNFSLGFFVGGQVLAGILGSAVTYGYGPEGKHGANYMQTMAASVASTSAMAVLIQAMVWLGMPMPAWWKLAAFVCCIGMFGVGVGMLYTPILVDKLQLEYPSGHAVANILRALTDKRLLQRSIAQLGGGILFGGIAAAITDKTELLKKFFDKLIPGSGAKLESFGDTFLGTQLSAISASTVGAGMVVGSRIGFPAIVVGGAGYLLTPYLRSIGWLGPHDPFRKIGFIIALAAILGAAVVDLTLIGIEAVGRFRAKREEKAAGDEWKQVNTGRLVSWVVFWAAAIIAVGSGLLGEPVVWMLFAVALSLLFVFVNGIANGISDQNPISSAFVVSVLLMSTLGLKEPLVGLLAASVLLVTCAVGVDMQQDRSTGWRLGTNRNIQFRYQVIGIVMGSIMCVALAKLFMTSYPVLQVNSFDHPEAKVAQWQSAMTFKFVGALRDLGHLPPYKIKALLIGLSIGLPIEILRKLVLPSAAYKKFTSSSKAGFATGWVVESVFLASPYASSFGGFVELPVSIWFGVGGIIGSLYNTLEKFKPKPEVKTNLGEGEALPEDMSTTSLVGGGLIAGESLYFLIVGIIGVISLVSN